MHHTQLTPRRIAVALAGLCLSIAACGDPAPTLPAAPAETAATAHHHGNGPAVQTKNLTPTDRATLAQLRATTTAFKDLAVATDAGWNVLVPDGNGNPCFSDTDPAVGAMGFHYLNQQLLDDPSEDPLQPELMLYEPQKNGRFRFVAVEYAVKKSDSATPPELFGQAFHEFGDLWILHVWHFDNNPSGIFTDFNPKVTCAFAPAA